MKMKAKIPVYTMMIVSLLGTIVTLAESESSVVPDNTIYGHVFDAQTGKPIPSALMYCIRCSPNMTDGKGYYQFGRCFSALTTYTVDCSKKGYRKYSRTVTTDLHGKAEADFYLQKERKPNPEPPFIKPLDQAIQKAIPNTS